MIPSMRHIPDVIPARCNSCASRMMRLKSRFNTVDLA